MPYRIVTFLSCHWLLLNVLCAPNWCLGGNQRELARQKNMKKNQEQTKGKKADEKDGNKGMSLQERKQRYNTLGDVKFGLSQKVKTKGLD